jgi:hypothetical protein
MLLPDMSRLGANVGTMKRGREFEKMDRLERQLEYAECPDVKFEVLIRSYKDYEPDNAHAYVHVKQGKKTLLYIRLKNGGEPIQTDGDANWRHKITLLKATNEGNSWKKAGCKMSLKFAFRALVEAVKTLFPNVTHIEYEDYASLVYEFKDFEHIAAEMPAIVERWNSFTEFNEYKQELNNIVYKIPYFRKLGFKFDNESLDVDNLTTHWARKLWNQYGGKGGFTDYKQVEEAIKDDEINTDFQGDLIVVAGLTR